MYAIVRTLGAVLDGCFPIDFGRLVLRLIQQLEVLLFHEKSFIGTRFLVFTLVQCSQNGFFMPAEMAEFENGSGRLPKWLRSRFAALDIY